MKSITSIEEVSIETDFPCSLLESLGTPKNRNDVTIFQFSRFCHSYFPLLETRILPQRVRRHIDASKKSFDWSFFLCDPLIGVSSFRKKPRKTLIIEAC